MPPKAKQAARRAAAARSRTRSRGGAGSAPERVEAFVGRSFVFCIRADESAFMGDLGRVCTDWLVAMHPSEAPVPDVWERVPSELLPDGAMIAYFNAHACMEDIAMPTLSEQPPQMSADSAMTMLQEFIDTGAHYDETLRAQFPLFRGTAPPGHPCPGAGAEGSPPSSGAAAPAHGSAPFSGRGRRLRDAP